MVLAAALPLPVAAQVITVDASGTSRIYCTSSQNGRSGRQKALPAYRDSFARAGLRYGISPDLLDAVARQESGYDPRARSPKGAVGIMQLMPATAHAFGVDPYDFEQNIAGGAAYLRYLLDAYDGRIDLALSAYNAGQGSISRYGGIPPFKETQAYLLRNFAYLAQKADPQNSAEPDESAYVQICRR